MYVLHQQLREKRELHYEFRHLVGVVVGLAVFGSAMFYTGLLVGERYGAIGTFHDPELVYESVFGVEAPVELAEAQQDSQETRVSEEASPELLHLEYLGALIPANAPRPRKLVAAAIEDDSNADAQEASDSERKATPDAAALAQQVLAEQARLAEKEEKEASMAKERAKQAQIARDRAEQARLAKVRAEQERLAKVRAERERLAKVRAEQERLAKLRAEQERLAKVKAEQEQLAKVKAEQERLVKVKAEQERFAQIKAEQERFAQIKAEQEMRATARAEQALWGHNEPSNRKKLPAVIRSQGPLPLFGTPESRPAKKVEQEVEERYEPSRREKVARSAMVNMSVSKRAAQKFTLQLFSFQDKDLAGTMVRTLKPFHGEKAYVTEVRKNQSVWYRVHMGTFKTLGDARTFQKSIEATRGLANTFLVSK